MSKMYTPSSSKKIQKQIQKKIQRQMSSYKNVIHLMNYNKKKSTEQRKIEKYRHIKAKEMEKITSQLWKKESEEIRNLFGHMEKYAKLLHREKYGEDYLYKPQKTKKRPSKSIQQSEY